MEVLNLNLLTRKSREEHGMYLRSDLLFVSLFLEDLTALIIPMMLEIDKEKSTLFGHSSRALSFDQRIQLLIELGALNNEHRTKFHWLLQIRNQFMHNLHAVSMETCLKYTSVKEKELLEAFDNDEHDTKEDRLLEALQRLCHYVTSTSLEICVDAMERMTKRLPKKYQKQLELKEQRASALELTRSWKKAKKKEEEKIEQAENKDKKKNTRKKK
ncbi:MAG: hypothetical protein IPN62_07565 [Flavobacteriales bacterium]|nr:hypothetical protein [Flavobacteriales bacterium]